MSNIHESLISMSKLRCVGRTFHTLELGDFMPDMADTYDCLFRTQLRINLKKTKRKLARQNKRRATNPKYWARPLEGPST